MPKAGDKFQTYTYQKWGEYNPKRESPSRPTELEEAYIAVPKKIAVKFSIYNSNMRGAATDYHAYNSDGDYICELKAQGCSGKGEVWAKQFAGSGNLKALEPWIRKYNVSDEDTIEVEFLSSDSLKMTKV